MAIERGEKLQTLKNQIPAQYSPADNGKDVRGEFEAAHHAALNVPHVAEKALNMTLFHMGLQELVEGDFDGSLQNGYRALGAHIVAANYSETHQRKKRKAWEDLQRFLMLQERLDRLYEDLAAIDRQLAKNSETLETIDKIYALSAAGAFDPTRNLAHKDMLAKAGIDLEAYKRHAQAALAERVDELNRQNDRLGRERQERVEQIRNLENSSDPADVQRYYMKHEALAGNLDAWSEQIELQQSDDAKGKSEIADLTEVRHSFSSIDHEVETFMKAFAEARLIEDALQRLARERDLVDGLSKEAAEYASFEEETEHLFEEGYFAVLDAHSKTLHEKPALASAPSSSI